MKRLLASVALVASVLCSAYAASPPIYGVRVDTNGNLTAPSNFFSQNASNLTAGAVSNLARSVIDVASPIGGNNTYLDATNATPAAEAQFVVTYFGNKTYSVMLSGSTNQGDVKHALAFPAGLGAIGDIPFTNGLCLDSGIGNGAFTWWNINGNVNGWTNAPSYGSGVGLADYNPWGFGENWQLADVVDAKYVTGFPVSYPILNPAHGNGGVAATFSWVPYECGQTGGNNTNQAAWQGLGGTCGRCAILSMSGATGSTRSNSFDFMLQFVNGSAANSLYPYQTCNRSNLSGFPVYQNAAETWQDAMNFGAKFQWAMVMNQGLTLQTLPWGSFPGGSMSVFSNAYFGSGNISISGGTTPSVFIGANSGNTSSSLNLRTSGGQWNIVDDGGGRLQFQGPFNTQLFLDDNSGVMYTPFTFIAATNSASGYIGLKTAGAGYRITEGSNAKSGVFQLNGTTAVTVSTTAFVSTNASRVLLTIQQGGGTVGSPYVSSSVAGTSFSVKSTTAGDTSTCAYFIYDNNP